LPISAKIGIISVSFALTIGICSGVLAALYQSRTLDYMLLILATLGVCIPGFVIATILIYIFALKLQWLPVFGLPNWKGLILPVIALSGYTTAFIMRLVRSSMIEVMEQDYIHTARAYGFSEPVVIIKHGLRNAILPVVSYVGPMLSVILTGSFVVEKIFALPGMGRYFVESISSRDYTTIMGFTIFDTVLLVSGVLIADIIYGLIDPRIKVYE
jgi:oligopeptide transport system permease protein